MLLRYFHLWLSFAKFSLLGELAFRGNFLIKVFVEILWLGILLLFNTILFNETSSVADWSQYEYLFFVGCYFAMGGMLETLFLENCNGFADLVRSGDLDFYLLKPIDEQFLVSCHKVDWSCAPNVLMGAGVMGYALWGMGWQFDPLAAGLFLVMFTAGVALAYGFLLALTAGSIWFMRNQSLFEMWWLLSTLMRYPREIFKGRWASPAGLFFSFAVPIMLVTNVPARVMVKPLDQPWMVAYMLFATVVVVWASRWFFRLALRRYRSASS